MPQGSLTHQQVVRTELLIDLKSIFCATKLLKYSDSFFIVSTFGEEWGISVIQEILCNPIDVFIIGSAGIHSI